MWCWLQLGVKTDVMLVHTHSTQLLPLPLTEASQQPASSFVTASGHSC